MLNEEKSASGGEEEHTFDPRPKNHVLPQSLTTVTTFSKLLALFLFILFPFVGFYLGFKYSSLLSQTDQTQQVAAQPTPTTDPTANWKTYTNTGYGLSFKYPPDWEVKDPKKTTDFETGIGLIPKNKDNALGTPLYIIKYDNPNKLDLKSWRNEYNSKNILSHSFFPEQLEKTLIAGKQTYLTEKGDCEPNYCYLAIILVDDKIFMFYDDSTGYSQEEIKINRTIFNQILSTFKFTNPIPTLTPTCKPRPACLDATPRCMIAETADMCPPSITPSQ